MRLNRSRNSRFTQCFMRTWKFERNLIFKPGVLILVQHFVTEERKIFIIKKKVKKNLKYRKSINGGIRIIISRRKGVRNSVLPPVSNPTSICFPDPRVDLLGYRYIGPDHPESNLNFSLEQGTVLDYNIQRSPNISFIN